MNLKHLATMQRPACQVLQQPQNGYPTREAGGKRAILCECVCVCVFVFEGARSVCFIEGSKGKLAFWEHTDEIYQRAVSLDLKGKYWQNKGDPETRSCPPCFLLSLPCLKMADLLLVWLKKATGKPTGTVSPFRTSPFSYLGKPTNCARSQPLPHPLSSPRSPKPDIQSKGVYRRVGGGCDPMWATIKTG